MERMSAATHPWPCPVCAELLPVGTKDCPSCHAGAAWIDLLRALDFSIRRFELWKLEGSLMRDEYRAIVADDRVRREAWQLAAQRGEPLPTDLGLLKLDECWSCHAPIRPAWATHCVSCGAPLQTPEVRLLRYQTFLCHEIQRHWHGQRLTNEEWQRFAVEAPEAQIDLLARLEKGRDR